MRSTQWWPLGKKVMLELYITLSSAHIYIHTYIFSLVGASPFNLVFKNLLAAKRAKCFRNVHWTAWIAAYIKRSSGARIYTYIHLHSVAGSTCRHPPPSCHSVASAFVWLYWIRVPLKGNYANCWKSKSVLGTYASAVICSVNCIDSGRKVKSF